FSRAPPRCPASTVGCPPSSPPATSHPQGTRPQRLAGESRKALAERAPGAGEQRLRRLEAELQPGRNLPHRMPLQIFPLQRVAIRVGEAVEGHLHQPGDLLSLKLVLRP